MNARAPKLAMDILELSSALSMPPAIVRAWIAGGMFPRPVILHGHQRWPVADVRRWLQAQREGSTMNPVPNQTVGAPAVSRDEKAANDKAHRSRLAKAKAALADASKTTPKGKQK